MTTSDISMAPAKVYYSYARLDSAARMILEEHLSSLRRQGLIKSWHKDSIAAGDERSSVISSSIDNADIIIFLVSRHFLASNFCWSHDMKEAMTRHYAGMSRVIPIIIDPCDWESTPFADLQTLPRDGRAISVWQNQEEAWAQAATEIRKIVEGHTFRAESRRQKHIASSPKSYALAGALVLLALAAMFFPKPGEMNEQPVETGKDVTEKPAPAPGDAGQAGPTSASKPAIPAKNVVPGPAPAGDSKADDRFEFNITVPSGYKDTPFNMSVGDIEFQGRTDTSGSATVSAPLDLRQNEETLDIQIRFFPSGYYEKTIEVDEETTVVDLRIGEHEIVVLPDHALNTEPREHPTAGEPSPAQATDLQSGDQQAEKADEPGREVTDSWDTADESDPGNVRFNDDQPRRTDRIKRYSIPAHKPPAYELPSDWQARLEDPSNYSLKPITQSNARLPPNGLYTPQEAAYPEDINPGRPSKFGLEVRLGGSQNPAFVQANEPDGESLFYVSLMLNTQGVDMNDGQGMVVLACYDITDGVFRPMVGVRIHGDDTKHWGYLDTFDDEGVLHSTSFPLMESLSSAETLDWWRKIEVEWTASDADPANGYVLLLVNGRLVATLTDVGNSRGRIRTVRMGLLQNVGESVGKVYFDNFISSRASIIDSLVQVDEREVRSGSG